MTGDLADILGHFHQIGGQLGQVVREDLALIDLLECAVQVRAELVEELDRTRDVALVLFDQVLDLPGKVEALGNQLIDPGRVDTGSDVTGKQLG